MVGARSSVDELGNLAGEVLADTGQVYAIGRRKGGDLIGEMKDGVGGVAVGADLERILVFDFEEIADLAEDACDRRIVHVDSA